MNSFVFRSTILWTALALLTSFAAPIDADAGQQQIALITDRMGSASDGVTTARCR